MKISRRDLGRMTALSGVMSSGWACAELEQEQKGELSIETVNTLLDAQGERGLYKDPEQFELLRKALSSFLRVQKIVREYKIPEGQEPAVTLRRD